MRTMARLQLGTLFVAATLALMWGIGSPDVAYGARAAFTLSPPYALGEDGGAAYAFVEVVAESLASCTGRIEEAVLEFSAPVFGTQTCLVFVPFDPAADVLDAGAFDLSGVTGRNSRSACVADTISGPKRFSVSMRRAVREIVNGGSSVTGFLVGRVCAEGTCCRLSAESIASLTNEPGAWSARLRVWTVGNIGD